MLFSWYLKLGDDASATSPTIATPSSALFVIACGWSTSGSAWSAHYLMVMDATDSVFQKRSTSFAAQFNYKRTFKTNVSLLISFSNLVSLSCLADVFSLHTHLAILKKVHKRAHFQNKSAQISKLRTWHWALQLQQQTINRFIFKNYQYELED